MTNYVVDASRLRVVRGGATVLRDLSFRVEAGKITGLLGPSGCGKTTLIRCIAGTQQITAGQLTVLDQAAGATQLRAQIGYAAQTGAVYVDLTVVENIRYFAKVLAAPVSEVDRVIGAVELDRHRDQLVARLSGGERSRVNLAMALLGTPKLLLLDEPTVGLDPILREQLWQLFRSLADSGLSLLVSSHVMDEAARCDGLVLMREGSVLAQESPRSLLERTSCDDLDAAFLHLIREVGQLRGAA